MEFLSYLRIFEARFSIQQPAARLTNPALKILDSRIGSTQTAEKSAASCCLNVVRKHAQDNKTRRRK